jgi:hypothetical protein
LMNFGVWCFGNLRFFPHRRVGRFDNKAIRVLTKKVV